MKATVSYGRTLQTAQYESVRIDVGFEVDVEADLPEFASALEERYRNIKSFVDRKVEEEEAKWQR